MKKQEPMSDEQRYVEEAYAKKVERITPKHNLPLNMLKAFLVGGSICLIGQIIINSAKAYGLDEKQAGEVCTLLLILSSAILTGLNLYPTFAKYAGAGVLVPITGFANSVTAPAIEFRGSEGNVFGCGTKIFTICGPVILYGIVTSFVLGFVYWVSRVL